MGLSCGGRGPELKVREMRLLQGQMLGGTLCGPSDVGFEEKGQDP